MSKKLLGVLVIMMLAAGLMIVGCGEKKEEKKVPGEGFQAELAGAPDWVIKGCYAYWGEQQQASGKICGVGSVGGTRNISLARSGAIARGRTEIARTLQVKVKAMLKDYQATVTGGEGFGTQASDEQYIVDVSKQITQMNLSGTEMVEIWISPNGTVYALVVLDVDKFKSIVKNAANLPEKVREAVVERANAAFDELDAATAEGE